jgi:hypothetical protein
MFAFGVAIIAQGFEASFCDIVSQAPRNQSCFNRHEWVRISQRAPLLNSFEIGSSAIYNLACESIAAGARNYGIGRRFVV